MEQKNINTETQPQAQQPAVSAADIDRRIQEAVERARIQWTAEQQESQRVAAMTNEERTGYELSRREADIAERERKLLERELRAMAIEKLTERGLPRELADALPYVSEAECMKALDNLERVFRQAVQLSVDARLRGETPVSGASRAVDSDSLTDEEYYKLNTKF